VPVTPPFFFASWNLLVSLITSAKKLTQLIISLRFYKHLTCNFYVHDSAKWDLGQATNDVTSGTGLKHSRDLWLGFECSSNIFGLFVIHILSKLDKIFKWKNCIIQHYNSMSSYDLDCCDLCIFFPFQSRVRCIVHLYLARIDNLPVHLCYINVQIVTEELAYSSFIVIMMSMNLKSWIFHLRERADFGVSKHF